MQKIILYFLLFLFSVSVAQAEAIHCQVTEVLTGDTFACITPQKQTYKISLYQIEAPKQGDIFGGFSTYALAELISGKKITVHTVPTEQKNNLTGVVQYQQYISCPPPKFPDGARAFDCYNLINVNLEMLRQGWARYSGTFDRDSEYYQAEDEARSKWYGIWGRAPNF